MRTYLGLIAVALCLGFSAAPAQAQNHYRIIFKGTATGTNSAGKTATMPISEVDWLRDYARAKGLKTLKNLAVSYHMNADSKGDAIEVIDVRTLEVQGSVLGLFFSEAFGRSGITNASGTQTKTLQYLYTGQDSHSLGAGVVTKTFPTGSQSYVKAQGQLQYELLPTSFRRTLMICSGSFMTGSPYTKPK